VPTEQRWKTDRAIDVVNLVLGVVLFLAPWMFAYATEGGANWVSWGAGLLIAALAIATLAAPALWQVWAILITGIAVGVSWRLMMISPVPMTLHLVVGVAAAVLAAIRLSFLMAGSK